MDSISNFLLFHSLQMFGDFQNHHLNDTKENLARYIIWASFF